ncbi:MAG: hypothetical protein IIZ68_03210, partial [Clostridia bacterium]|nr:hypothetical protein [Clostridia bacterium]
VIGEVETLLAESENISFYAEIVPAADVKNCTNVFVITEFEGQRSVEANSIEGYKTEETDESAVG